jgi:hypothetical protein
MAKKLGGIDVVVANVSALVIGQDDESRKNLTPT